MSTVKPLSETLITTIQLGRHELKVLERFAFYNHGQVMPLSAWKFLFRKLVTFAGTQICRLTTELLLLYFYRPMSLLRPVLTTPNDKFAMC